MTWQDSLRQLDARLANGEIGAAEYRRTRDEILAEASSGTQAVSFDAEATTQWVSTPPVVPPAAPPPAAPPQPAESDEETTQVVTADMVTTPPPPPPMPPQQQQQFGPPMPPPGLPPQMPRPAPIVGPEVFSEVRPAGGGRRVVWFLVPLLVIALAAAGVWWFVLRDDDSPATAQDQQQTTTTTAPKTTSTAAVPAAADVAEQVPRLPGQAKSESGTMTPDAAQQQKLLTPAYAKLLADGGAKEIVYRKSAGDGYGYLLIAAPVQPAGHAPNLATTTSDDLKSAGFAPAQSGAGQPAVFTRTDTFFRTFVTMYAAGDVWVQLNVSAAPDGDENALRTEFDNVLGQVLEQLPAG
jgi:hypothetical protein